MFRQSDLKLDFGRSLIVEGRGLLDIPEFAGNQRAVVFTDQLLMDIYRAELSPFETIVIPSGDEVKTLAHLEEYVNILLDKSVGRKDLLVAFGGGAICDFTGFLASVYQRGMSCIYIPTTVLAQVDAAIGGKTGVNHGHLKNMIGTFSMPTHVLLDPRYCITQDDDTYKQGFAEMVKHALIMDADFFTYLENNKELLLSKDLEVLTNAISKGSQLKIDIVKKDSKEQGIRKLLNFGHTIGHAIERIEGIPHGAAVSIGMVAAAHLSATVGQLKNDEILRIVDVLKGFNLPVVQNVKTDDFWPYLLKDKKSNGQNLDYVFLDSIGSARIKNIPFGSLRNWMDKQYEHL